MARWALGRRCAAPALALAAALLCPPLATAQSWFDVTQYRAPGQCERMQCLSVRADNCRDHLEGFYLKEKGCQNGQACTSCEFGNSTVAAICYCENPPYNVPAAYGELCGMGKECSEGECFRPCYTFMHITICPSSYCRWDAQTKTCEDSPPATAPVQWLTAQDGPARPSRLEGEDIVVMTQNASFPLDFETFRQSALGFRIEGELIDNITSIQSLFLELDLNIDGWLSAAEYRALPDVLGRLEQQVITDQANKLAAMTAAMKASANATKTRRLDSIDILVTPEVCNSMRPRQYYCSFDVSCKSDCRECGWKSATDKAFSTCVVPTPEACFADGGKVFCDSDQLCHPAGDCSNCVDRPVVDYAQHKCLQLWWSTTPLLQMKDWVCRYRNKVGMPCRSDQDCVYGLRRCLLGQCQPFQPYNPNQTCVSDLDCPHLGYYCPADPTGGENRFWIQYCRVQGEEQMTCQADRECKPGLMCNTAEPQPRCRGMFSLRIGTPASDDTLCTNGWRDRNSKCAPPAKSKQVGRSCHTNEDCKTTDQTGRSAECVCKSWWEQDDAKYCAPVAGDYAHHQEKLRDYLSFRAKNCGTFWTETECLRVFGTQALKLKLAVECERQRLSGGPFLPAADCGIVDYTRFPDPCAQLDALR